MNLVFDGNNNLKYSKYYHQILNEAAKKATNN